MPLSSALTAFAAFLIPVGLGTSGPRRRSGSDWIRRRQERREYQQLLSMDDHIFDDIGRSRAEVEAALHACSRG